MLRSVIFVAASCAALLGCATNVNFTPVATGGSKADGVVNMGFEYGSLQRPVVDWDAAKATATKRCRAWGYRSADPFAGATRSCVAFNQYGCYRYKVNRAYQCRN